MRESAVARDRFNSAIISHILTLVAVTCQFKMPLADFSLLTKNALTFPEVDTCSAMFSVKLGLHMLSAIILATGTQKVLFAQFAKHIMFSLRG